MGDQGYGSATFLFFYPQGHSGNMYVLPRLAAEVGAYSLPGDAWGKWYEKATSSPFDMAGMLHTSQFHVRNGVSVLDDVVMMEVDDPAAVVKWYHDRGIFEIRGVPVEERIVSSASQSKAKALLKKEIAWRKAQASPYPVGMVEVA